MKKLFTVLLISLWTLNVHSQVLKKTYYDIWDKEVHEVYYANSAGYGNGSYKKYDRKGALIETGTQKNGEKTGEWIKYTTASGQRKVDFKETYKNGKLNGPAIYYFENSDGRVVQSKGLYVGGEKNGKWECINRFYDQSWNSAGKSHKGANFKKFNKFYNNGEVVHTDGEDKAYFYPSKVLASIETYENGIYSGNQIWYNPDGTVKTEKRFATAEEAKVMEEEAKVKEEEAKVKRQIEKVERDKAISFANNTLDSNKVEEAITLYQNIGINTKYLNLFLVLKKKYENGEIDLGTTSRTFDTYGDEVNSTSMGSQLVKQLTNRYLKQNTLKVHEDYCLRYIEIKELEKLEIENLNKEVQGSIYSYTNENMKQVQTTLRDATTGKLIMRTTYLKNKIIYTKSIIVLEAYIEAFNIATLLNKKQELGKKVMDSINTLNQIPESDWKDLKKQLKKVDDPEQIKTILKI